MLLGEADVFCFIFHSETSSVCSSSDTGLFTNDEGRQGNLRGWWLVLEPNIAWQWFIPDCLVISSGGAGGERMDGSYAVLSTELVSAVCKCSNLLYYLSGPYSF